MLEYLISAIIGAIVFMLIYYFSTKKNSTLCALIVALPIMGMYGLFNICKNNSDINRFGRAIATGTSMRNFSKTLVREKEPGTYMHYVSINTQILGFLLQQITNKTISEYLYEKIWDPLGMEDSAYFILDDAGDELALGGLNASLRDYAKFGLMYLQKGRWNNTQILSEKWIEDSYNTDAAHLVP